MYVYEDVEREILHQSAQDWSVYFDFCIPFSLMEKDSVDSCTLFGCENRKPME